VIFKPDHNGECLHCDEWLDAHGPGGECPTDPAQAVANTERFEPFHARYLEALCRRDMIDCAREACRASGIPVYDHHPLCSNFTQPVENCWQCRIITTGAAE
jgi:hypothetical protein